jgi:starch synthase (maltosyl-transferring)
VALDYALQCSPDHPWVREHPEWFKQRPDGSIRYAENPPKKYQDIHPLEFWPARDEDRQALWHACRDVLLHWIGTGIRIFRVDNPHTKPLAFWAWLIDDLRRDHPDLVFLAEAFTTPPMMAKLAEIGFSQSYTYFTWRHDAAELREYVTELTQGPLADYMRPAFWPNTPDILAGVLRDGPPSAFALRLVLAATLVPTYGVYSGYELCENKPASETNEEYAQSEKYEIKHRDYGVPGTLAPLMRALNEIRRRHPGLWALSDVHFHETGNPQLLAYSRGSAATDLLLCVVNLDPVHAQEAVLRLDTEAVGLAADGNHQLHDELGGDRYEWFGQSGYVRLDPGAGQVAHLFHVSA